MKKSEFVTMIIFLFVTAALIGCSKDSTVEPKEKDPIDENNVSGTWTLANSPYQINEEITIPDGETLTIEPGVEVIFNGHYKFYVKGRLLALGTKQDMIIFTATAEGWHGIKLVNISNSNDSTIFEYCTFQFGKANTGSGRLNRCGGAINTNINKLRISHCLFQNNMTYSTSRRESAGGAIAIGGGDPVIEYCEFRENESVYGAAMIISGNSNNPLIRNNHFHNNYGHGTINIDAGASPILVNNLIERNYTDGHGNIHIAAANGRVVMINNTIVYNTCDGEGGAVFVKNGLANGLELLFINNIIYGNEPAQFNLLEPAAIDFINCLIEGGKNGFTGSTLSGTYQNCIDSNPLFVSSNDFHLQNTSPCIGIGAMVYEGHNAPTFDLEGNLRPNPAGSNPDIGSYENSLADPN